MKATTVTTIDSTMASLNDIEFPTVYICNINQVRLQSEKLLVLLVLLVLFVLLVILVLLFFFICLAILICLTIPVTHSALNHVKLKKKKLSM